MERDQLPTNPESSWWRKLSAARTAITGTWTNWCGWMMRPSNARAVIPNINPKNNKEDK